MEDWTEVIITVDAENAFHQTHFPEAEFVADILSVAEKAQGIQLWLLCRPKHGIFCLQLQFPLFGSSAAQHPISIQQFCLYRLV